MTREEVMILDMEGCEERAAKIAEETRDASEEILAELSAELDMIEERKNIIKAEAEEKRTEMQKVIEKTFPNASYIFCRDNEGNEYCNMLGGGQAWPHTVILDEDGVIRTIIPRATTYAELKEAIDAILAD